MSIEKRKTRKFRKKLLWIFLYLVFLVFLTFSFYLYNYFKKPLLITPLGRVVNNTDLERQLKNAKIPFSSVSFDYDSTYKVALAAGGTVRISSKKDITEQISSLQRILRELTIEGKSFKSIDFRFEKPVVEFN